MNGPLTFMAGGLVASVSACVLLAVSGGGSSPPAATPGSGFAARINTACKRGYVPYDWQLRDEFHTDIPPGMVKVTCVRRGNGGGLDQYPVAVPR